MSSEEVEDLLTKSQFPTRILLSFSLAGAALGVMWNVVLVWMPFYYEHVVGMPTIFYFIGMGIFTVWDAFNELIAGVVTDKVYSFSKRFGRRFPWVLISSLPFGVVSILIFLPPGADIAGAWLTFIYFVIILFIWDALLAFWTVSSAAIRSDKFRSDVDRRKIGGFQAVFGTLGGVFGAVTGGIFISLFGGIDSATAYLLTMGLFALIGTILAVLALPGARDSEKILNRAIVDTRTTEGGFEDIKEFFKVMGRGFKNTNFRAFTSYTIANSIFGAIFAPSLTYYVVVILKYESEAAGGIVTLLSLPFTLTGIILIPLFLYLIKKYGHVKIFKIVLFIWPISLIPFLIFSDIISAMIFGAFIGAIAGLLGVTLVPVFSDMIDEGSVLEGRRIDSTYNAINMFLTQIGQIIFAATIFLIHDVFTDYDPALGPNQSLLAEFGIRAQIAIVPMIFIAIAAIYFYKAWKLTPEDMVQIKAKLIEMGIKENNM